MKFSDQIRHLINNCGKSRYRISQESGVPQSTLSLFVNGRHIQTASLDRLAPVIGLKVIASAKKPRRKVKAVKKGK